MPHTIINLTPHAITVVVGNEKIVYPASGTIARVATVEIQTNTLHGIPVFKQEYGSVESLPMPDPNVDAYIVSAVVLAALKKTRHDVVAPNTGPTAIRENGQIVAVRSFVQ